MFFSLAFLSFSLILFLMFSVWFKCCWFVLGVYGFILYAKFLGILRKRV
ncbi:putative membrane protein [Helicobacter pylori CPY1313]|nr:putative membrane protein [Helicobacter pylori CPY1313]